MVGWVYSYDWVWTGVRQTNFRTFSGSGTMHVVISYGRRIITAQQFCE